MEALKTVVESIDALRQEVKMLSALIAEQLESQSLQKKVFSEDMDGPFIEYLKRNNLLK